MALLVANCLSILVYVSACDFTIPTTALPKSLLELASDESFTASVSSVDDSSQPHHSRLNPDSNGWIPSSTDEDNLWLQVDLGHPQFIAMLRLSPPLSSSEEYVTKAEAECSLDGVDFTPFIDFVSGQTQIFEGTSETSKHETWLHLCRFVRILPKDWVGRPALRWDLKRCPSEFTSTFKFIFAV